MLTLSIYLFGKFCVQYSGREQDGFDAHKARELFSYLLLYRQRAHPRENLASLLWEGTSTAQSKTYLRKALWQLQTALNPQAGPLANCMLHVDPDWIQINPQAQFCLDVAIFEQAFALVQDTPGVHLDSQQAEAVQKAVELYRGDLLDGWYLDWCLYERERLQHMYLALLDKLMGYCENHQHYERGLGYAELILRCDRAQEQTHGRLMRLYYLSGDRTAALRQYERCVEALDDELGVQPTSYTTALYEQMRENRFERPIPAADHPPLAPPARASSVQIVEMLDRLKHIHTALMHFQGVIQQDIETLEQTLNPES